jgi:protein-S-isoprenylcysteine O-methyltransferase Ste14
MMLLALAWVFFYFLHSALASNQVKHWFSKRTSLRSGRSYRLFYNGLALLFFILLLLFHVKIPSACVYVPGQAVKVIGILLIGLGSLVGILALRSYNASAFMGLAEEDTRQLHTTGLNAWVRHPLYSSTLLLLLGICILYPAVKNWMVLLITSGYLFIGIRLEEKKLVDIYGMDYTRYQQKVKQLIPWLF